MSDSYPTIQDELSEVQKEFMGCVEMHLDPPEHEDPSYAVHALYHLEEDAAQQLPGEAVRFTLSVDENHEEISERRHEIEFMSAGGKKPRGWVRHVMRRVEAGNGHFFWTESRFEVAAPGLPDRQARAEEVEGEVRMFIDKIRLLDRQRKLVEGPATN